MNQDLFDSRHRRYRLTLDFMRESLPPPATILDLGETNPLSNLLEESGYKMLNTEFDLDRTPDRFGDFDPVDACTAFEILEHLLNPMSVLEKLPGERLFASVPLSLWFASAYRNENDPRDRHFHEFEEWQFDWLMDHSGWSIVRRTRWTNPVKRIGIRPLLRLFTPRWYVVEAVRKHPV